MNFPWFILTVGFALWFPTHALGIDISSGNQPLYQQYSFGRDETVIDLGSQPLWLPAGMVMEVMRRDPLLAEEMAREGVEVRVHPFLKGSDVNNFLHLGRLEGGIGGDMPAIAACTRDRVRVVSLMDLDFTTIVARHWMPLSELRGKTIGVPFGANAHHGLLQALAVANLPQEAVQLVNMDIQELPEALREGRIDAFSAWEPISSLAIRRDGARAIHRVLSSGYLYFSRTFHENHPQWVRRIIAAQVRALDWLADTEENTLRAARWVNESVRVLIGKELDLTDEEIARLSRWGLRNIGQTPLIPTAQREDDGYLARATAFLASTGKIPATTTWNDLRGCFRQEDAILVLEYPSLYHIDRIAIPTEKAIGRHLP
ncbi:NMT1 domain-containing protein [Gammaproteobacteria bacterium]